MNSAFDGSPHPAPKSLGTDRAARSLWVLLAFLGVSVLVLAAVSRAVGPASMEGWNASSERPVWELPMPVRSTVWYIHAVLISAAAWLVWAYPQPGLRRRAAAVVVANLLLAGVARPVILALVPVQGSEFLWLLLAAMALLAVTLATAAVAFWRTHRVFSLLMIPCILWPIYVGFLALARIAAAGIA